MLDADVKVSKPGKKTTEFWITVVAIALSATMASGVLSDHGLSPIYGQVVGIVCATLAALGYQASRAVVKQADASP